MSLTRIDFGLLIYWTFILPIWLPSPEDYKTKLGKMALGPQTVIIVWLVWGSIVQMDGIFKTWLSGTELVPQGCERTGWETMGMLKAPYKVVVVGICNEHAKKSLN